jgi:uncharacterized protein (TIGR02996 family)
MRDVTPFIRAILDHPDDDAPRLVLADFLEEGGSAQGEFIRLQCERARLDPGGSRYADVVRREQELVRAHGPAWLRPMHNLLEPERAFPGLPLQHAEFRRGLVEAVRVDARAFLRHADELMLLGPVREVCLVVMEDDARAAARLLAGLAALDCWPRVESLALRLWTWTDAAVVRFLARAELPRLRELRLYGHQIGPPVVGPLLRWRGLPRLDRVDIQTASPEGAGLLRVSRFRTLFQYPFES